jgi:hypothetical protein
VFGVSTLFSKGTFQMTNINTVQLSDAFASYATFVEQQHQRDNGQVTEWGQAKARLIIFIEKHVPSLRLADWDLGQIEQVFRLLANRPPRLRDGKPISLAYAKALIKEFRRFLRWLHKSGEYLWRLPEDYEVHAAPIKVIDGDRHHRSPGADIYSKDELATLWSYATPWERCLMLLGLNCGFGMAEVASLKKDEVYLNQPHPFQMQEDLLKPERTVAGLRYSIVVGRKADGTRTKFHLGRNRKLAIARLGNLKALWSQNHRQAWTAHNLAAANAVVRIKLPQHQEETTPSWIRRTRAKTGSYGEWRLWPETVSAIELLNQCNNADQPFAVVTLKGNRLMENGSRSNKINHVWRSLNSRIQKARPDFPSRPFSTLRKTSAHLIGNEWGSDIAALFLTHSMSASHHHLDHYTLRPFAKLLEATESLRNSLSDVFDQK